VWAGAAALALSSLRVDIAQGDEKTAWRENPFLIKKVQGVTLDEAREMASTRRVVLFVVCFCL
jgi:hypothetical protein